MAHYNVIGVYTVPGDKCGCEHCEGHTETHTINDVVVAETQHEAIQIATMAVPIGARWKQATVAGLASLEDIERYELAQWNAGSPTSSPFALATARGEL